MAAAGSPGLISARYGDSPVNTDYPRIVFTCTGHVATGTPNGIYPITLTKVFASNSMGTRIKMATQDGHISVGSSGCGCISPVPVSDSTSSVLILHMVVFAFWFRRRKAASLALRATESGSGTKIMKIMLITLATAFAVFRPATALATQTYTDTYDHYAVTYPNTPWAG